MRVILPKIWMFILSSTLPVLPILRRFVVVTSRSTRRMFSFFLRMVLIRRRFMLLRIRRIILLVRTLLLRRAMSRRFMFTLSHTIPFLLARGLLLLMVLLAVWIRFTPVLLISRLGEILLKLLVVVIVSAILFTRMIVRRVLSGRRFMFLRKRMVRMALLRCFTLRIILVITAWKTLQILLLLLRRSRRLWERLSLIMILRFIKSRHLRSLVMRWRFTLILFCRSKTLVLSLLFSRGWVRVVLCSGTMCPTSNTFEGEKTRRNTLPLQLALVMRAPLPLSRRFSIILLTWQILRWKRRSGLISGNFSHRMTTLKNIR